MDPESIMQKIDKLAVEFKSNPTCELAERLEKLLTMLKLCIGIFMFDELKSYVRLERTIERYLDEVDMQAEVESTSQEFVDELKAKSLDEIFGQ